VTSNAPLRAGKGHAYEGGIRVPLIVSGYGVARPGTVCDDPVSGVDYFPTITAMAGARAKNVDGIDIAPLLKGGKVRREALYWHYPHYSNQGGVPAGAVRQGDFKLIEFYEDGRLELFNLRDDPGEKANLARKLPKKAAELHALLKRWRGQVNARMPEPNPAFDPAKADQGLTGVEPKTEPI
jgi:arylsulfatase A-like enzyme